MCSFLEVKFYLTILQHLHNSSAKEIAGTLAKEQLASSLRGAFTF
jgi:hypothetical protein